MSDPSYSDGKLLDTETDGSTVSVPCLPCVRGHGVRGRARAVFSC